MISYHLYISSRRKRKKRKMKGKTKDGPRVLTRRKEKLKKRLKKQMEERAGSQEEGPAG